MLLNKKISIWYFICLIKHQILLIVFFAVFIGFLDSMSGLKDITLPLSIPSLIGTVLSLLLAFRTSQSYERWWEARIIWGAIVNDSRTLIRQLIHFMPEGSETEVKGFANRQIIWAYALGESLRRLPFSEKVCHYLDTHQIEAINIPNALLDLHMYQLRHLVKKGQVSEFRQIQLDSTLARLCDSMGKCERIKNTVFPRSYSMLLHVIIYLFAVLLPFGLDDSQLVIEIILTILFPTMFIAIEKTAILMQDPFENSPVDTPMTTLAQTIEVNIGQMLHEKDLKVGRKDDLYYQM